MQANTGSPVARVLAKTDGLAECDGAGLGEFLTAAPPAIVPRSVLLISMTFLTVCDAIQFPAVALESVATIMPP
jgi:hypothetical protein